jgi:hypothetical protein
MIYLELEELMREDTLYRWYGTRLNGDSPT